MVAAWGSSILLSKSNHPTCQSATSVAGGLAIRKSTFAKIIRVSMHHNASPHDAAFAVGIEADLFVRDVHCGLVTGCINVAKIPSMSARNISSILNY